MPTLISGSTGVNKITDGTIVDADVTDVAASKLTGTIADARFPSTLPAASAANLTAIPAANITGTLPAISGANLTGISGSSDYRPLSKPIIINGDMQVAERGTSGSVPDSGGEAFTADRNTCQAGGIGVYTTTQESLTSGAAFNAGFKKASRIDCATAVASPAGGDYFYFQHIIEAQDCLAFKKGTSNAETMTVAFWVKSNKTGTSQLTVKDGDNDRICAGTYVVSSANTWEHKVISIAADTSGAMNNDTGRGFIFEWWLGGGSSYTSGTAPTAWEARTDGDRGANNLAINDNTANDWAITGLQVEVGTYTAATLPPFQFENYGDSLARCQRYFNKSDGKSDGSYGRKAGTSQIYSFNSTARFATEMRASPSTTITGGDSDGSGSNFSVWADKYGYITRCESTSDSWYRFYEQAITYDAEV